ncbi:magnesium transporter CorA family protein [Metapseudomonas otitidis]|uniref:magnesium transporter CorA family protein n=1 Tax=Metapseudomonas otitidis TaxID=319939 RepID=UPI001AAE7754|nr:magnesium transporter CorA family protein [Pseudomonas otitidis]MBO2930632.1 magnesium transporter CorA family protein [Pseudomonas otitidis]
MLDAYRLGDGRLQRTPEADASVLLCVDPDAGEREHLCRTWQLDQRALDSALDPDEVSRIEFHGERLFLIWKRPERCTGQDGMVFEVSAFGMLLEPARLLVIAAGDSLLQGVGQRGALATPRDVLLDMLFSSVHHYLGHLRVIKLVARELQARFNRSLDNSHLMQMVNLSESLIHYLNAIQSNATVLVRLRNHAAEYQLDAAALATLDDLIIENEQCYKQARIYSTVFAALMDARGSLANHGINDMLRKLTLINVVFLPLNLVASIGGMSEFSMMTAGAPWWVAYPLLLLGMLLLSGLMLAFLRRMAHPRHQP